VTEGQRLALRQLEAVAAADPQALEIISVREPDGEWRWLTVEISLDCSTIQHRPPGIRPRQRERLRIYVDPGFPWDHPAVHSAHGDWAGTPHVQWGSSLCLYAAPTVEWQPHGGMFGFLKRLELWLRRAAVGELDPADAPLHPPVTYSSGDAPRLVIRSDAPEVGETAWVGLARIRRVSPGRLDVIGWTDDLAGDSHDVAPAVLLPTPMDWEYPTSVRGLLDALAERGVSWRLLLALLRLGALRRPKEAGMPLVVGTPMRRLAGGEPKQHLVAWYLSEVIAEGLRLSLNALSEQERLREIGAEVEQIITDWADKASVAWCRIDELRPEVTERRDAQSPMRKAFAGKTVAVWGCGAIGAHAAEWIARAGAARLLLYDKAAVTPGILARQPFTDRDVGQPKAAVLAERLDAIEPDLTVEARVQDVLSGPLERDDWHDGADVVIDATAAVAVASKLEAVRRRSGAHAALVGMLLGHTAEHGLCAVAPVEHSGATADVLRRAKLACASRPGLEGFADEFWPDPPRSEHFQPEPGCSDATFRGSGAEVAALTGALLTAAAGDLVEEAPNASAHLLALPTATHVGRRQARLDWPADVVLNDGMRRYEIRITCAALRAIRAWINRNDRTTDPLSETGGVLFGQRDPAAGVLWVDEASGPPPDSVASREEFICGTQGVAELNAEKRRRTRASTSFVGMWHTHPGGRALPSERDVASMSRLVSFNPLPELLMLINGGERNGNGSELGAYVFVREELPRPFGVLVIHDRTAPEPPPARLARDVGLALSGGGSRAIAFHLGCLRALHDRGALERVQVVSGVSGGAIAAAIYAYSHESFAELDARVRELLRRGLQREIVRRAILHPRAVSALAARVASATAALAGRAIGGRHRDGTAQPPVRRWASRTDALEATLAHRLFGSNLLDAPRRNELDVVINACDLRTGSAVRFGSRESAIWRIGRMTEPVRIATAVAASAAYPLLLPSLDRYYEFERRDGTVTRDRLVLTDGGVFDNLGTSCLEPGRSEEHSYNIFSVDRIIACDAGRGLLADAFPVGAFGRVGRAFETTHRKAQDASRGRLHTFVAGGELAGFIMPYLGQQDSRLPWVPPDLVPRERVAGYPTNFSPMRSGDVDIIARRGEQLTHVLIDRWLPEL
jgi:predicted acylesterase/phospholipase RssA/molybdopterin/thiamine biosynthesis adenylyltransferase/proteasome lid subunit RPN8/RPN11